MQWQKKSTWCIGLLVLASMAGLVQAGNAKSTGYSLLLDNNIQEKTEYWQDWKSKALEELALKNFNEKNKELRKIGILATFGRNDEEYVKSLEIWYRECGVPDKLIEQAMTTSKESVINNSLLALRRAGLARAALNQPGQLFGIKCFSKLKCSRYLDVNRNSVLLGKISHIAFSRDSNRVCSALSNGKVILFGIGDVAFETKFNLDREILGIMFGKGNSLLAVCAGVEVKKLYYSDQDNTWHLNLLWQHDGKLKSAAHALWGERFAFAIEKKGSKGKKVTTVIVIHQNSASESYNERLIADYQEGKITSIALSISGDFLAVASDKKKSGKTVEIFHLNNLADSSESYKPINSFTFNKSIKKLAFNPADNTLAIACDGELYIRAPGSSNDWSQDIPQNDEVKKVMYKFRNIVFSPDGDHLAIYGSSIALTFLSRENTDGEDPWVISNSIKVISNPRSDCLEFSPSGYSIAWESLYSQLQIGFINKDEKPHKLRTGNHQ